MKKVQACRSTLNLHSKAEQPLNAKAVHIFVQVNAMVEDQLVGKTLSLGLYAVATLTCSDHDQSEGGVFLPVLVVQGF